MKVLIQDGTHASQVRFAILMELEHSRFECDVRTTANSKGVTIHMIRKREAEPYCGSHPAECEVGTVRYAKGQEPKAPKAKFLEGLDWVEFNDRLNDALDKIACDANASSAICIIRKGILRRTHYGFHVENNGGRDTNEWNKDEDDGHWQNWCGEVAPASSYPQGTPGSYEREVKV